jgi:Ca-activated chloride channel homolog
MQFFYPHWLQALWLVLAVGLFFAFTRARKKKMLARFAHWSSLADLARTHSSQKERIKQLLLLLVLLILVLTLAQPQWGDIKREVKRKGVEIIFLIDTSLSMLAEDVGPNRLERAKFEMKSFLKELEGDRVGIVSFAGAGFVQSPLTLDYDAFLLFANSIQVGYIPDAGTSLSQAIRTAVRSFPDSQKKHQVVILMSDGEHQDGDVEAAIEVAQEGQVRIYTIGFATPDGAPIPLRSEETGKISGYKKDRAGEIVITKLNDRLLERIAEETGGLYSPTTADEREIGWFYEHMQDLDEKEFKERLVVEREDHFQIFLAIALILLSLEMMIGETKKEKQDIEV